MRRPSSFPSATCAGEAAGLSGRWSCAATGGGARLEPGHLFERSHSSRRGYGHTKRMRKVPQIPIGRLRTLHQLRALPDVPVGDLLGSHSLLYYANTRRDAAKIAFDDAMIYREVALPINRRKLVMRQLLRNEGLAAFEEWKNKVDKVRY
jgi:hypothetical protein